MKLSCIIVEDEPPAFDKLKGFVQRIPFLELAGGFDNAIDALDFLKDHRADILFLDIQMDHLTGIQMLECLKDKPYVIITSAYADYALKGYELDVFDYLLKPYSFERLLSTVNKVYADYNSRVQHQEQSECIFVKSEYRIENIHIKDILYVEGMQAYLRIYMADRKIMARQTMKNMVAQLPQAQFMQVHKSWLVNISRIACVERNRIKIGNQLIPIGDTYRDAFFKRIGAEH